MKYKLSLLTAAVSNDRALIFCCLRCLLLLPPIILRFFYSRFNYIRIRLRSAGKRGLMPNLTAHISSFKHVRLQQFHEFFTLPAAALKPKRVKAEYASTKDPIFVSRGWKGEANNVLSNVVADSALYFSDSPVSFKWFAGLGRVPNYSSSRQNA